MPSDTEIDALIERIVETVRPYTRETLFIEELRELITAALAATNKN